MPYKLIEKILAPPRDRFTRHIILTEIGRQIEKEYGAKEIYCGNPNREIGKIIQTEDELTHNYVKFVPRPFQHSLYNLWHKLFSSHSKKEGNYWGLYIKVEKDEKNE